jgi:hypothetical protein
MVTFLSAILVLIVINLALLLFSTNSSKPGLTKFNKDLSAAADSKIYSLNLNSSKFKKAI